MNTTNWPVNLEAPTVTIVVILIAVIVNAIRRLIPILLGLLAALVFASAETVSFAAVDARPYALALFFLTGHVLAGRILALAANGGTRSRMAAAARAMARPDAARTIVDRALELTRA